MSYQKPDNAYEIALEEVVAVKELSPYPSGKGREFAAKKMEGRAEQGILETAYDTVGHLKADRPFNLAWDVGDHVSDDEGREGVVIYEEGGRVCVAWKGNATSWHDPDELVSAGGWNW